MDWKVHEKDKGFVEPLRPLPCLTECSLMHFWIFELSPLNVALEGSPSMMCAEFDVSVLSDQNSRLLKERGRAVHEPPSRVGSLV